MAGPGSTLTVGGLDAAVLAQARQLAASTGQPLMASLQLASGLDGAMLTEAQGAAMGYPVLSMQGLLQWLPRFDLISFGECSQQGLLVACDAAGQLRLVLSDPFDGRAETWARHRLGAIGAGVPAAVLAHPDDLAACLSRQEQEVRALDSLAGMGPDPGRRGPARRPAHGGAGGTALAERGGDAMDRFTAARRSGPGPGARRVAGARLDAGRR